MELQQCDIVVQGLAVVVMVDVGGGNAKSLRAGASVFPSQIVVTHSYVDSVA